MERPVEGDGEALAICRTLAPSGCRLRRRRGVGGLAELDDRRSSSRDGLTRLRAAATRRAPLAANLALRVVAFGSKLVLLERVRLVFDDAGSLGVSYRFTRLRSDGVWTLDRDVPMDRLTPLTGRPVTGRFKPEVEAALRDRGVLYAIARAIVEAEFPPSVSGDVLVAVGLDPNEVYAEQAAVVAPIRRRNGSWPAQILAAWDRQCAFCGYDGQLGAGSVGVEAAHVRWFNFGGPDDIENGLALCSLDHKLFDRGALGLTDDCRIRVTANYTARTGSGRRIYDLADRALDPRPGTPLPAAEHLAWHAAQVFKGAQLVA